MKNKRTNNRKWNTIDEIYNKRLKKIFEKKTPDEMKHKPRWRNKFK